MLTSHPATLVTESFPIVAASARALWALLAALAILLSGVLGLLAVSARGASTSRFDLSTDGLRLRGDLYSRFIPAPALRGGAARIIDLNHDRELAPALRTMGTALPGYHSGWFKLRNGQKALLYLTDRTHAVYVPTTNGYDLLLSPQDPERFVAKLRAIAPRS